MVALVHFHHRNLCRTCPLQTRVFAKVVQAETSTQFGWIRGSINLSLIEIAQMEACGSPMLGAVHRGVNYDPVSLCGLVALPRQSLTCGSGVFHFKTAILLRSRSNRAKVRGYRAPKWFITTSTARTPPTPSPPLLLWPFAYTISPFGTHTATYSLKHISWIVTG